MALRLALPVVALLLMVDVALALLGRLNQQLQLLALAFPAKMLTALRGAELGGGDVSADSDGVERPRVGGRAADVRDMRAVADKSGKTEEPTQRRLDKARKEGQFPSTKEFVGALQFMAFLGLLGAGGADWFEQFRQDDTRMLLRAGIRPGVRTRRPDCMRCGSCSGRISCRCSPRAWP